MGAATATVLLNSALHLIRHSFEHYCFTAESDEIRFSVVSSSNFVQFPKLRTPFTADLERPTNIRTKVVIATALVGLIEPRAWSIDRFSMAEICRLGCGWCGAQTLMVGYGVFTANWKRDASLEIEKERRMSYGQTAGVAFIAR